MDNERRNRRRRSNRKGTAQTNNDPLASPPSSSSSIANTSESPQERAARLEALYKNVEEIVIQDNERSRISNSMDDDLISVADSVEPPNRSVVMVAAANLCSATLGAGVLALPFAMKEAGIVMGVLLLVFSAAITVVSISLIVAAQTAAKEHSMEALSFFYLGMRVKKVTEVCILIFCLGCSVSYVIAVGDILYITLGWNRLPSMIVIWSALMMPLSMFRHMRSFRWTSGTGVAAIGTLIFSAFLHLMNDDYEERHKNTRWTTNDTWAEDVMYGLLVEDLGGNSTTDDTPVVLTDYLWPAHGLFSILKACPIVMFAFSCQINVPAIYQELPDPKLMQKVTLLSVSVCFLLYLSISIIALADFGDRIEPNVLVNYKHDSGIMQFACACMAAAVITAFPLNIFPSRITILGMWRRRAETMYRHVPNEMLTAALLEDEQEEEEEEEATPSIGSKESHYGAVERSLSIDVGSERSPSPVLEDHQSAPGYEESDMFELSHHVIATLLLTGTALLLAILIPDISVVFGLLGGTTTSILGFIIPGALALRLNDQRLVCIASVLLVGGIVISVLTTSVTVYSTFSGSD
jgi:amino acid permease